MDIPDEKGRAIDDPALEFRFHLLVFFSEQIRERIEP